MSKRKHAVLVPGFAGFDALGQLSYYFGVTEVFNATRGEHDGALHYFDSFPTSSVKVRAERLRRYLAKKIDRGEIRDTDEVTLIGHSTGGLDIRATLDALLLAEDGDTRINGHPVSHARIVGTIKRLVFISVPHYGTNIADYVASLGSVVPSLLQDLGRGLRLNEGALASVRELLASPLRESPSDLLLAILDALNESDLRVDPHESRIDREGDLADERDARAALTAWLEHIGDDIGAIDDLRSWNNVPDQAGKGSSWVSPAHKDARGRQEELQRWGGRFATRSYATRAPLPPGDERSRELLLLTGAAQVGSGPLGAVLRRHRSIALLLLALPRAAMVGLLARASAESIPLLVALVAIHLKPELPFELSYSLCADPKGPFRRPTDPSFAPTVERLGGGSVPALNDHDNDGIVNTLSMLWPHESSSPERHRRFLIDADHGDVIGHHSRFLRHPLATDDDRPRQRVYHAYDLLLSRAGFKQPQFEALWRDILGFALAG